MPIVIAGHQAEMELENLVNVIEIQIDLFQRVRDAKSRVMGLGSESDCEEYQRLSVRVQPLQNVREKLRANAIAAGASPKFVRKWEKGNVNKFSSSF